MRPVLEHERALQEAREAYRQRRWRVAHGLLTALRDAGVALDVDDVTMLADCAWWRGRIGESIALSEEVHQTHLARGDAQAAGLSALEIGFVSMMRGDLVIGSGWMNRARRLIEDQPPGLAYGLLRYVEAGTDLAEGRHDQALAGARELQEMGLARGMPTLTALGLATEGVAHVRRGDIEAGFTALDEAMLTVLGQGVRADWAGSIYCSTMLLCHQLADVRRARAWQRATEEWCAQFSDAVMFQGICRLHRAQLLHVEGQWDEAEREVEQVCVDLAGVNVAVVAEGEYQRGEIHRTRGDTRAARASYQRAAALGREPEPGWSLLLLLEGRSDEAWASVNACLARSTDDPFARVRLLLAHVEVALACGRPEAAERSVAELGAVVGRYDSPGFRTWMRHAQGAVALARGNPEEAVDLLREAERGYRSLGARYEAARVGQLLGDALARTGAHDLARAAARSAEQDLRRLGARAAGRSAPAGLSAREVEVLTYVARGASNRDVAAALSISDKTVGRHLANVFAKIGVSSRTAAAAWAHEKGLTASSAPQVTHRNA